MTDRGKRLADMPKHGVFMPHDVWDRLHRIAAHFGFRNHSGPKVGYGNVTKLSCISSRIISFQR